MSKILEKKCSVCYVVFLDKTTKKSRKFCSKKCSGKFRQKRIKINCAQCGFLFETTKNLVLNRNRKFCSIRCMGLSGRGKAKNDALVKYMKQYGSWFIGKKLTKQHKENLSKSHKGQFVSLETRKKQSERMRGNKNPFWKGGHTNKRIAFMSTAPYREWRKEVFKKDKYRCIICNMNKCYLQAHHIMPFSQFPDQRLNIKNGQTLCIDCHKLLHKTMSNFKSYAR